MSSPVLGQNDSFPQAPFAGQVFPLFWLHIPAINRFWGAVPPGQTVGKWCRPGRAAGGAGERWLQGGPWALPEQLSRGAGDSVGM